MKLKITWTLCVCIACSCLFLWVGCTSEEDVDVVRSTSDDSQNNLSVQFTPRRTEENAIEITAYVEPADEVSYSWTGTDNYSSVNWDSSPLTISPFSDDSSGDITLVVTRNSDGVQASQTKSVLGNNFPYNINSPMGNDVDIIFLHHSTGGYIWGGDVVSNWFANYNASNGTNYTIDDREYPKGSPTYSRGWVNDPYDYWLIWIENQGYSQFEQEDTLELLIDTSDYDVVIWKHCYTANIIHADSYGEPPIISSDAHAIDIYQAQYNALKEKMHDFPNARFLVWTGAANIQAGEAEEEAWATRARTFSQWVVNEWDEPEDNIYVFDFRQIQTNGGLYFPVAYSQGPGDSHPGNEFSAVVAPYFSQRIIDVIEGRGDITSVTGGAPEPILPLP